MPFVLLDLRPDILVVETRLERGRMPKKAQPAARPTLVWRATSSRRTGGST